MGTQLDIFSSPLPAHVTNAKSKTMLSMGSGISGGGFGNRISLRNSKFRFIQNGSDVGTHDKAVLPVVVFALADHVQRMFYEGAYDGISKTPPTCFSMDGKVPSPESPKVQSAQCATCSQNVKGSGRMSGTKACAYKKRVIVLSPDDLEGPAYALDVSGQSMFGEQDESKNLYSFKGFYEKLVAHNMDIAAIVTQLSFDDAASVPKLHFSPIRALSAEEFAIVQERMGDDDVAKMLKDMTNSEELDEQPAKQITRTITHPVGPSTPAIGTYSKPEPEIPQPMKQGVGGLVSSQPAVKKGFGGGKTGTITTATSPQNPTPTPTPAVAAKAVAIDLAGLVDFDD